MKNLFAAFLGVLLFLNACGSVNENQSVSLGEYQTKDGKLKLEIKKEGTDLFLYMVDKNDKVIDPIKLQEASEVSKKNLIGEDINDIDGMYEGKGVVIVFIASGNDGSRFKKGIDLFAVLSFVPVEMYKVK